VKTKNKGSDGEEKGSGKGGGPVKGVMNEKNDGGRGDSLSSKQKNEGGKKPT